MTTMICFIAWMYAALSDKNKSSGLAIVCWFAWIASLWGIK